MRLLVRAGPILPLVIVAPVLVCSASGCGPPQCTDTGSFPGDRDGEVGAALEEAWFDFGAAIAPAAICVSSVDIRQRGDARHPGGYRRLDRRVYVAEDSVDWQVTTLRHELCHAWDFQVSPEKPPEDVFVASEELPYWSFEGDAARESFAWTCSLMPQLTVALSEAACTDFSQRSIDYVAREVYPATLATGPLQPRRFDVEVPELRGRAVASLVANLQAGPHVSFDAIFEQGEGGISFWLNTETGTLAGNVSDPVAILAPPDQVDGPADALVQTLSSGSNGQIELAVSTIRLMTGEVERFFVRTAGGQWTSPNLACGLPVDRRTAVFVSSDGVIRTASVGDGNQVVVLAWDDA
ncbi:MAG: hypothetical protein AAF602_07175 [Myxococcota bacterium]